MRVRLKYLTEWLVSVIMLPKNIILYGITKNKIKKLEELSKFEVHR